MSNHNYIGRPPNFVPRMNPYENSEYVGLQYEPLDYPQPIYYGRPDPIYYPYVPNYMEQPLPNHNIIYNKNVMPEESSSYYGAESSVNHLNDSAYYPEFHNNSSYWEGSGCYSIPSYQFNNYHTRDSHNAENFYYGDDRFFGYESPVYCGFYYPNMAYSFPCNTSPFNVNMPFHGYPRHFNTSLCGSYMYPVRAENSGNNYEAPHKETDNYDSGKIPFVWGENKTHREESTRYHNRELPSILDFSPQQPVCENSYDSEPINTLKVEFSSTTLESSSAKELGQAGKSHCDDATPTDIEPASLVETKNSNASTSTEVLKEEKKKSKTRRKRSKRRSNPIFYIEWDGFDEQECETVGQVCPLCEQDLSFSPEDGNDEYYELIDEPQNYPQVSVLPCGHVFHIFCLEQATPEEQSSDPICYLCLSCES